MEAEKDVYISASGRLGEPDGILSGRVIFIGGERERERERTRGPCIFVVVVIVMAIPPTPRSRGQVAGSRAAVWDRL